MCLLILNGSSCQFHFEGNKSDKVVTFILFTNNIFRTNTLVKSSTAEFHLNKNFEEKTIDDRIVDTVFSLEEEVSIGRFLNIKHYFFHPKRDS